MPLPTTPKPISSKRTRLKFLNSKEGKQAHKSKIKQNIKAKLTKNTELESIIPATIKITPTVKTKLENLKKLEPKGTTWATFVQKLLDSKTKTTPIS